LKSGPRFPEQPQAMTMPPSSTAVFDSRKTNCIMLNPLVVARRASNAWLTIETQTLPVLSAHGASKKMRREQPFFSDGHGLTSADRAAMGGNCRAKFAFYSMGPVYAALFRRRKSFMTKSAFDRRFLARGLGHWRP